MIIRGLNATTGEIVRQYVTPLSSEEIARRQAIRDAKRVQAVDPRDALLDLVVSKLVEAGTLKADEALATGAALPMTSAAVKIAPAIKEI